MVAKRHQVLRRQNGRSTWLRHIAGRRGAAEDESLRFRDLRRAALDEVALNLDEDERAAAAILF